MIHSLELVPSRCFECISLAKTISSGHNTRCCAPSRGERCVWPSLSSHSHPIVFYSGADGQKLKVQVWATKDGSFVGKEEDPSAWECIGEEEMVLNTINYNRGAYDSSEAQYGALPLTSAINVAPGSRRGECARTNACVRARGKTGRVHAYNFLYASTSNVVILHAGLL